MNVNDNVKFAIPLHDGLTVEAVWYAGGTLCLSCQAGCAVGCPFCASGARGLRRNLNLAELIRQLEAASARGFRPERLTVSGIGEPLHNPRVVRAFLEHCRLRRIPVSFTTTGGPLEQLAEFLALPHNGLMLSLHAGTAPTHRRLVPGGPDFEGVWRTLGETWPRLSRRRRRKVGVNYLLLAGVNDSREELAALAERLRPFPELTVHLLLCNPVPGSPFASPPAPALDELHRLLAGRGLNVRRANRWRRQQRGGCGTLVARMLPADGDQAAGVCRPGGGRPFMRNEGGLPS